MNDSYATSSMTYDDDEGVWYGIFNILANDNTPVDDPIDPNTIRLVAPPSQFYDYGPDEGIPAGLDFNILDPDDLDGPEIGYMYLEGINYDNWPDVDYSNLTGRVYIEIYQDTIPSGLNLTFQYTATTMSGRPIDPATVTITSPEPPVLVDDLYMFNYYDPGPYRFGDLSNIASDQDDNVYMVSGTSVKKFDSSGNFLYEIGRSAFQDNDHQYPYIQDIAVDVSGNIYVLSDSRVFKFNTSGTELSSFNLSLGGYSPYHIGIDSSGSIYIVATYYNYGMYYKVLKFDNSGGSQVLLAHNFGYMDDLAVVDSGEYYILQRQDASYDVAKYNNNGSWLSSFNTPNSGPGSLQSVGDMHITNSNIYISDRESSNVQVYDSSGNYVRTISGPSSNCSGNYGDLGALRPSDDPKLCAPRGVTVNSLGDILVADAGNSRVQKFNSAGDDLLHWGAPLNSTGENYGLSVYYLGVLDNDHAQPDDPLDAHSLNFIDPDTGLPTTSYNQQIVGDNDTGTLDWNIEYGVASVRVGNDVPYDTPYSLDYIANSRVGVPSANSSKITISRHYNNPITVMNFGSYIAYNQCAQSGPSYASVGDSTNATNLLVASTISGYINTSSIDLDPSQPGRQTIFTDQWGNTVSADSSGIITVTSIPHPEKLRVTYTIENTSGDVSNVGYLSYIVESCPG